MNEKKNAHSRLQNIKLAGTYTLNWKMTENTLHVKNDENFQEQ